MTNIRKHLKKARWIALQLVFLTIACGGFTARGQDQGCDAVLIPSVSWIKSHTDSQLYSLKIMDRETFQLLSTSAGGDGTVPIHGVPVDFNADWEQFQSSREKVFRLDQSSSSFEKSHEAFRSEVPKDNLDHWLACKKIPPAGTTNLRCTISDQSDGSAVFVFQIGPVAVTIEDATIEGGRFGDSTRLASGTIYPAGTSRGFFIKRDNNSLVKININASGYTCQADWAAIIGPPPPPPDVIPGGMQGTWAGTIKNEGTAGSVFDKYVLSPEGKLKVYDNVAIWGKDHEKNYVITSKDVSGSTIIFSVEVEGQGPHRCRLTLVNDALDVTIFTEEGSMLQHGLLIRSNEVPNN